MPVYFLDPTKTKKEIHSIRILYGVIALVLLLLFVIFVIKKGVDLSLLLFLIVLLGLLIYTARRSIRQRKQFHEGYQLELTSDSLTQSQPGFKDLTIQKSELNSILESKFGLVLSTKSARNSVGITKKLPDDAYQQLRSVLYDWLSENLKEN